MTLIAQRIPVTVRAADAAFLAGNQLSAARARGRGPNGEREAIEAGALPPVVRENDHLLPAKEAPRIPFVGQLEASTVRKRKHRRGHQSAGT